MSRLPLRLAKAWSFLISPGALVMWFNDHNFVNLMTSVEVRKQQTLTGHRDSVYTVVAGDEPARFLSGAGDGMVVLWDLSSAQEGVRVAQMPNSVYSLLHISHMGVLIAGHNYDGIHVLDWKERKELSSLKTTDFAIFD